MLRVFESIILDFKFLIKCGKSEENHNFLSGFTGCLQLDYIFEKPNNFHIFLFQAAPDLRKAPKFETISYKMVEILRHGHQTYFDNFQTYSLLSIQNP